MEPTFNEPGVDQCDRADDERGERHEDNSETEGWHRSTRLLVAVLLAAQPDTVTLFDEPEVRVVGRFLMVIIEHTTSKPIPLDPA